jgi:hypothetical protein
MLLPLASAHPDGLEKVAETLGFGGAATEVFTSAPIPDYDAIGDGSFVGGFVSEIVGIALVLIIGFGVGYLMRRENVA